MNLQTFDRADQFLEAVEATLLVHEAENALMLGIARRLCGGYAYGPEPAFLSCVEEDGAVVAVATRTPPHNLLVREERGSEGAFELVADHLKAMASPLPGVHGMRASAERFAKIWSDLAGIDAAISMKQRLYRLTEVTPPIAPQGSLRPAIREERKQLTAWVAAFVNEAVGGAPHPNPDEVVDRLTSTGDLVVWDDEGPRSMAGVGRPTETGISINLVYTPPEHRGKGYASACVAALSQRQLDRGRRFCTLFTDLANPTSNALYQRIGYRPIADFLEIRFRNS